MKKTLPLTRSKKQKNLRKNSVKKNVLVTRALILIKSQKKKNSEKVSYNSDENVDAQKIWLKLWKKWSKKENKIWNIHNIDIYFERETMKRNIRIFYILTCNKNEKWENQKFIHSKNKKVRMNSIFLSW